MTENHYNVGEQVQVYLDAKNWKSLGWQTGTVIRIDPYSEHRSFFWVELDTFALDNQGGKSSVISILNPKNIRKLNSSG